MAGTVQADELNLLWRATLTGACVCWDDLGEDVPAIRPHTVKLVAKSIARLARTLLVAKGVATRSQDGTRGSWPYY